MRDWFAKLFSPPPDPVEETSFPFPLPQDSSGQLDVYSETWAFVLHWAHAELSRAREDNDSSKRDEIQTALLRGRIRTLKELIALPDKKTRIRQPSHEEEY